MNWHAIPFLLLVHSVYDQTFSRTVLQILRLLNRFYRIMILIFHNESAASTGGPKQLAKIISLSIVLLLFTVSSLIRNARKSNCTLMCRFRSYCDDAHWFYISLLSFEHYSVKCLVKTLLILIF